MKIQTPPPPSVIDQSLSLHVHVWWSDEFGHSLPVTYLYTMMVRYVHFRPCEVCIHDQHASRGDMIYRYTVYIFSRQSHQPRLIADTPTPPKRYIDVCMGYFVYQ